MIEAFRICARYPGGHVITAAPRLSVHDAKSAARAVIRRHRLKGQPVELRVEDNDGRAIPGTFEKVDLPEKKVN